MQRVKNICVCAFFTLVVMWGISAAGKVKKGGYSQFEDDIREVIRFIFETVALNEAYERDER